VLCICPVALARAERAWRKARENRGEWIDSLTHARDHSRFTGRVAETYHREVAALRPGLDLSCHFDFVRMLPLSLLDAHIEHIDRCLDTRGHDRLLEITPGDWAALLPAPIELVKA
jgi:hypothetical protein